MEEEAGKGVGGDVGFREEGGEGGGDEEGWEGGGVGGGEDGDEFCGQGEKRA